MMSNQVTSLDAAMTIQFHNERQWRGASEFCRSVKMITLTTLVSTCVLLTGCAHSKRTYIQVVDGLSNRPLDSAKVTASLYDPVHPDLHRTHISAVRTKSNGMAVIRIPMCNTRGVEGGRMYEGGRFVDRADANSEVGPELLVEKEGYIGSALYRSNDDWRYEETSPESPFVVSLTRDRTEPGASPNAAPPHR